MGCGCGGQAAKQAAQQQTWQTREPPRTAEQMMAEGGPGTPSYVWNGPVLPPAVAPVAEPAAAE